MGTADGTARFVNGTCSHEKIAALGVILQAVDLWDTPTRVFSAIPYGRYCNAHLQKNVS